MSDHKKNLAILGTRGIPASHGGFETFAEKLAKYLVGRGWEVTVYCQEDAGDEIYTSIWQGIRRIHIPVRSLGYFGSIVFDFRSIMHSLSEEGICLTLGYNTAVFNVLQRICGRYCLINMDGIEWRRQKWGFAAKAWFWLNERIACRVATQLIADNPGIENHLSTSRLKDKITMIPYGAEEITSADVGILADFGLEKESYALVVARPVPENSVLEMVTAFSASTRGIKLVVLGRFEPENCRYHREVMNAASIEVTFPGAIYDKATLDALRFHCLFYLHGHQVGGTNPSLVEALGAGNAVIAHDNIFNRWVAGSAAIYFAGTNEAEFRIDELLSPGHRRDELQLASITRFRSSFTWELILTLYERLLEQYADISVQP